VHFNVSHSHDLVVIALSEVVAVGVDVEQVLPRDDLDELAAYVFAPKEHDRWRKAEPTHRIATFHEAWVRHEAVVKASGTGLCCSATTCRLSPQAVRTLAVQDGYRAAVAWLPIAASAAAVCPDCGLAASPARTSPATPTFQPLGTKRNTDEAHRDEVVLNLRAGDPDRGHDA
jgi:4'-phosphopantetheinyl transferase